MSGSLITSPKPVVNRRLKAAVHAELGRILRSEPFRASKRSQDFLEHVVQLTLEGRQEEIKEREIGINVFGRDPSYNTNEDSIVRVKANEVRRKLAEYKLTSGPSEVQIELPRGSYVPEFEWAEPLPDKSSAGSSARSRVVAALVCLVLMFVSLWAWSSSAPASSPLEEFWAPVLNEKNPVLICLAHPTVYHLSNRVHEQFRARTSDSRARGPYAITLNPKDILGEDVIPIPDQYVGAGDAQAAIVLSSMLKSFGQSSRVRIGNDVSFAEIRNSPTILIGALTNRWTFELMDDLRFFFESKDGVKVIRDRVEDKSWFIPNLASTGKVSTDYLIVSRVFDSKSGQIIIFAGGLTQYGTQAAGEFLCQPELWAAALKSAPADWPKKNLQFVLETNVIGSTPAPARVLATHIW